MRLVGNPHLSWRFCSTETAILYLSNPLRFRAAYHEDLHPSTLPSTLPQQTHPHGHYNLIGMDGLPLYRLRDGSHITMCPHNFFMGLECRRQMYQLHSKYLRRRRPEYIRGFCHHHPSSLRLEGSQSNLEKEIRFGFDVCFGIIVSKKLVKELEWNANVCSQRLYNKHGQVEVHCFVFALSGRDL